MSAVNDEAETPRWDGVDILTGGDMGALMRAMDWSTTPLGSVECWSPSLRTMVRVLLSNRFPLLLWWGADHIQLYNDAYRPVLGSKHPRSLGQPARECFPEIWHIIGPVLETPYSGGPATWDDDLFLELHRHGFLEETHFTVAYSPVPDDTAPGGIGGVLATVHETTQQVIQERRLAVLSDLGARSTDAKTTAEACATAARVLEQHAKDVPFALLYLVDPHRESARLTAAAGTSIEGTGAPTTISLTDDWNAGEAFSPHPGDVSRLVEVLRSDEAQRVAPLRDYLSVVPPGPWSDPPDQALTLPIPSSVPRRPSGVLVLGLSSRVAFDDAYRAFSELVAGQIGTSIVNAQAYEEERRRAEALAELDRAKTSFFSNVSHEFRTPLTLLLGPLEDSLEAPADSLPADQRKRLEVAHRNALRLLRLVNTLLDFSRIEAGRVQASYEPIDLPAFTAELASTFRSAIEAAGLRLVVDCPPLRDGVEAYVDRDMWEKIVLNLLSNAFKFTFEGEISVRLRPDPGTQSVQLVVQDTGAGIPAEEVPKLFERFHRVQGIRARTHEGTGIGLALVQELAALHGGTVGVQSTVDEGTTFTVSIPTGNQHLPPERVSAGATAGTVAAHAAPYVEEALRWLPDEHPAGDRIPGAPFDTPSAGQMPESPSPVGDRGRVLLADDNADMREYVARLLGQRYDVETVADGDSALAAVRSRPPDLVLSDVMMPGLDGFALIRALRSDARTREVPVILLSARAGEEARVEGIGAGADDYLVKPFSARELLARVGTHLELARVRAEATQQEREARAEAESERQRAHELVRRVQEERDRLQSEIEARLLLEDELQKSHAQLNLALAAARAVAWEWEPGRDIITTSDNLADIYGVARLDASDEGFQLVHPEDREAHEARVRTAVEQAGNYDSRFRVVRPDTGELVWLEERGRAIVDSAGVFLKLAGVTVDVTARARVEVEERRQAALLALARDAIITRGPGGRIMSWNAGATLLYGWEPSEAVGQVTHALLHTRVLPDGRDGAEVDAVLAGEGAWEGELEHTRRNGTRIIVESRQALLRTADGTPEAILEVNRDVTARAYVARLYRLTAALTATTDVDAIAQIILEEGRAALGAAVGVVSLLSDDGATFTNLHVVGYAPEVVAAWPGFSAADPVPIADAVRDREILTFGSIAERETRYPHLVDPGSPTRDGALVAIPLLVGSRAVGGLGLGFSDTRTFSVEERDLLGTLGELCAQALERARLYQVERDARRAAESELGRLQQVLDTLPEGVVIVDAHGRVLTLNQTGQAIVGLDTKGRTLPRTGDDAYVEYGIRYPDETPYPTEDMPLSRSLRHGDVIQGDQELLRHATTGRDIPLLVNSAPLFDASGDVMGAVAVFQDITALRDLDRAREEFLSSVAHDLKTPLTSIRGQAQLAERWLGRLGVAEDVVLPFHGQLERIVEGTDTILGLINELVDVTRIQAGASLELQRAPTDVVDLVRRVTKGLESEAPGRLQFTSTEREVICLVDGPRLQRVIGNLLSNAIKYSPAGGSVHVSVSTDGEADRAGATIVVRDQGLGIPAADLPHIFDRFHRARNVVAHFQGAGIGLASARQIVEDHGGTIEVESEEGGGATFTVRIPMGGSRGTDADSDRPGN